MKKALAFIGLCLIMLSNGCTFTRYTAIPQVKDCGPTISTRFKYRLEEYRLPKEIKASKEFSIKLAGELRKTMVELCPNVFSDDGVPFVVSRGESKFSQVGLLSGLISFLTIRIIPQALHNYRDTKFSLDMSEDETIYSSTEVKYIEDVAISLSPFAMFFYNGAPDVPSNMRFWYVREYGVGTAQAWGDEPRITIEPNRKALAYAIAVKLKELEDSGRIEGTEAVPNANAISNE